MFRRGSWPILALAGLGLSISTAQAEDVRGRWSFGLEVGFLSTLDGIRNNAAVLELRDPRGLTPDDIADDDPVSGSIDLRNDDLLGRETEIEERQRYTMTIGYGLTSWLSLQVDLGYYKGNVSNLDTLRISRRFADANFDNFLRAPFDGDPFSTPLRDSSVPIGIGDLEQIPVMFSAVVRFRKDSAFNPILGAGVGWIFTDFNESDAFRDMNREILRGFQRTQIFDGEVENRQMIEDSAGSLIGSTTCKLPLGEVANAQEIFPDFACNPAAVDEFIRDWDENTAPLLAADRRALLETIPGLTPDQIDAAVAQFIETRRQNELEPRLQAANSSFVPTEPFITAEVDDGFAYQLIAGAQYHFNEHWSAYVLGRYLVTGADLVVRIADNGNIVTSSILAEPTAFETNEARFLFLSESNCNINGTVLDPCSSGDEISSNEQPSLTNDEIFVQGGKINLTSFSIGFGVRYTF